MSTSGNDHTGQPGSASLKRKATDTGDESRQSRRRRTDVTVAPVIPSEPLVPSSQQSSSRKRAHSDEEDEESDAALSNPSSAFDARPHKQRRTTPPPTVQDDAPGPSTRSRGTKRGRGFGDDNGGETLPASHTPSAGLHWEPEDLVGARPAPHTPQEISPLPEATSGSRAGRRRAQKKRRRLASRTDDEEEKEVLAILFPPLPPSSSEGGSDRWSIEPASVTSSQREVTPTPPQALTPTPALVPAPAPVPAPIPVPTPSQQVAEWAVDSVEETLARVSRMAKGTQWLRDASASGSSRRRPRR